MFIEYKNFIDKGCFFCLELKSIKSYYQTLALLQKYLEEEKGITEVDKVGKEIIEEYLIFTKERGKY